MTGPFEYDVAISFAGEQRDHARRISEFLKAANRTVFFDKDEQATLWGKDLYEHLSQVYERKARFCVMLVSKEYADCADRNLDAVAAGRFADQRIVRFMV